MRYIKRFIEDDLLQWRNDNIGSDHKYVMEITGSRQVGKTTTVLHFANKNYKNVIYVNTGKQSDVVDMSNPSIYNIEGRVTQFCSTRNLTFTNDSDSIIIFDEIQESAELYESIRIFNRELKCDIIVTGSNLQKTVGLFQPAGDMLELRMYPLSYEEYINHYGGYDYYLNTDINTLCTKELKWFQMVYNVYKVVGGYPSVFNAYLDGRNLTDAFNSILKAFKSEFRVATKNPADYDKIEVMFETICEVLCREKKGDSRVLDTLSKLTAQNKNKRISAEECNNILAWLSASRIVNFCNKVDLKDGRTYPSERFYFDDIGLLNFLCTRLHIDQSAVNGIVAENFIFKQLKERRFDQHFYGSRPAFAIDTKYELDFLVTSVHDDSRYGIEVKSGNNSGKSIQHLLDNGKIDYALYAKGSVENYSKNGNVYTIPIFLFNKFTFDKGGVIEIKEVPKLTDFV